MSDFSILFRERPESGGKTGDGELKNVTRIYNVDNDVDIDKYIPARGSLSDRGDGYFLTWNSRPGPGYTIVVFIYTSDPKGPASISGGGGGSSRKTNSVETDLSINIIEKALEDKKPIAGDEASGYRTKWNFDLYAFVAAAEDPKATPDFWATAIDRTDADGIPATGHYFWGKSKPADPAEGFWKKIEDRTKKGVEVFIIAQAIIREKKYCKKIATAEAFLKDEVGLADPPRYYGFDPSTAEPEVNKWLAFPVGISNDGQFFVASNEYQFADEWDTDLYEKI